MPPVMPRARPSKRPAAKWSPRTRRPDRTMLEKLRTIFQVPELRRRILFTLALFVIYRFGEHMPTPGVNAAALAGAVPDPAAPPCGPYATLVGGAVAPPPSFA